MTVGAGASLQRWVSSKSMPGIIDFPLSNCVNSGIDTVGILTQYQPLVLNEYIGNGQPWDLDRLYGGVHVLPPYQKASGRFGMILLPKSFSEFGSASSSSRYFFRMSQLKM